jgi:hypothetical protein
MIDAKVVVGRVLSMILERKGRRKSVRGVQTPATWLAGAAIDETQHTALVTSFGVPWTLSASSKGFSSLLLIVLEKQSL